RATDTARPSRRPSGSQSPRGRRKSWFWPRGDRLRSRNSFVPRASLGGRIEIPNSRFQIPNDDVSRNGRSEIEKSQNPGDDGFGIRVREFLIANDDVSRNARSEIEKSQNPGDDDFGIRDRESGIWNLESGIPLR